ncbi:hypothetical protein F511_25306 [Dorcoceras hygrometricum]|uniref:Dystroglycan-like n=1 Tax=Dorcoceras hygrometricum TaxID=472368 RepID=A0A2Z7CKP2_9LAMI|nr:hypothetical protein F511_25306 [Dorcoceras hygrometricum]
MFKSLEDTGLKGFLEASGSVYEAVVVEFFANAKVIAGTMVSFIANQKLALTKDVFAEAFDLPTEGLVGFLDIPSKTMAEMRLKFSGTDVPFRTPNNKNEIKMEYRLLHDIVAKALCAKAGSFDVVMCEKFDLVVANSAGLKVNWSQVPFQTLVAMVNTPPSSHKTFTFAGERIFAPVEIREINWATHFLPNIAPTAKGKGMLEAFARPNPVEEHCQLVPKTAWEDVSSKMADYDEWVHFSTVLCEMEVQKRVDEHRAKFKPAETLRSLAGLPLLTPKSSIVGDAANMDLPQITWFDARKILLTGANTAQPAHPHVLSLEFSPQEEQEQAAAKQSAQQEEQIMDNTAKELTSLKDSVSSLDLKVECIKDDTHIVRHGTVQLSQQHLVDEISLLKSQVAEMFDCLKELHDAKKWEEPSKELGPSIKKRRLM